MDNRFFSLIIVPDSGNDIKSSSFNSQFLVTIFGVLLAAFFVCLFFIVGYHVKLSQEKNYRTAVSQKQSLLSQLRKSEVLLTSLTDKLDNIQKNDNALRLYASIRTLDHDMYQAGVGGRVIFDRSEYSGLSEEFVSRMESVSYGVTRLNYQAQVEKSSLAEIGTKIKNNLEIIDNTPTFWPALTAFMNINSGFGARINPVTHRFQFHEALDIDGHRGDKIVAAADGVVTWADWKGALGQCVIIQHKYGYETTYGHLDTINATVGAQVKKGEFIGTMGSTGRATGTHLHYAIKLNGQPLNPRMMMFKAGI
jgi:murein DD-endopeptidase MepM/ murein hydrolase activator NlpD